MAQKMLKMDKNNPKTKITKHSQPTTTKTLKKTYKKPPPKTPKPNPSQSLKMLRGKGGRAKNTKPPKIP